MSMLTVNGPPHVVGAPNNNSPNNNKGHQQQRRQHLRELNHDSGDNTLAAPSNAGHMTQVLSSTSLQADMEEAKQAAAISPQSAVGLHEFEILKVLGKGAYGKVYQVRKIGGPDSKTVYAMKAVDKKRICDSKTDQRHTRTERDVLATISATHHPFLIKMYYAFETPKRLYFVQEFCRGGELFRLMEVERMFLEDHARFYLCEIALALEYLHSLNIVYRDLKTENIMLDADGHIKLIDFGLSKVFSRGDELTTTFCGTVEYMAPEVVIKSPGHGKPADWWSYGIFMYDLLTGRSPFHSNRGKRETKERILRGKFTIPPFLSAEATDLLRRLLRRNVDKRLSTSIAVKAHPFFALVEWDLVAQKAYQPPHVPDFRDGFDDTDVSQFDPRFTSRSPKESESGEEPKNELKVFGDFDYVSPEFVVKENNLIIDDFHDMQIRGHGE